MAGFDNVFISRMHLLPVDLAQYQVMVQVVGPLVVDPKVVVRCTRMMMTTKRKVRQRRMMRTMMREAEAPSKGKHGRMSHCTWPDARG